MGAKDFVVDTYNEVQGPFIFWQRTIVERAFDLAKRGIDAQAELDPFLFKELGFEIKTRPAIRVAPDGTVRVTKKIVSIDKLDDPTHDNAQVIEELLQEKAIAAINGEIDNPALEQRHAEEQQQLEQKLFNQFGGDYASSTAGIEAMNALTQRQNIEMDEARRADMISAVGLAQQQGSFNTAQTSDQIKNLAALTTDIPGRQVDTLLGDSVSGGVNDVIGNINEYVDQVIRADAQESDDGGGFGDILGSAGDIGSIVGSFGSGSGGGGGSSDDAAKAAALAAATA